MFRRARKESQKPPQRSSASDEEKPLWEHIAELKRYIFVSLGAIAAGAIFVHSIHDRLIAHLLSPLGGETLIFLKPTDPLFFILKLDFFGGLLLAFPIILWCVLRFLSPALGRARRKVWLFLIVALLLGAGSLAYAYLVLLPIILGFLLGITVPGVETHRG